MSGIAVRLEGVRKTFKNLVAVADLSLDVRAGELFGLLGPNGAGKTTTLRMITNILRPDAGRIEILGQPAGEATRDRLGYMPEERGLYPRMILFEQLLFLARSRGCQGPRPRGGYPLGSSAWALRKQPRREPTNSARACSKKHSSSRRSSTIPRS